MSYPALIERGGLIPRRGGLHSPLDGLGPVAFGPALLLSLDYTKPTAQTFPATAAAFAALTGATPKHIWLCDEASGNLVDEVAGKQLSPNTSPLQGQVAVGPFDGVDCHNKACVEGTEASSQNFRDTSAGLSTTDSVAILVVFRATATPGATQYIASYFGGTFELQLLNTGTLRARSGTSITGVAGADDGALHYAVYGKDVTADEWRVRSDLGTDSDLNPGNFTDGNSGIFAAQSGVSAPAQVLYVATFEGGNAETALGAGAMDPFWTHAQDPGGGAISPKLDTYTRASVTAPVVGNEAGFGVRVAKYGSGQFAHAYNGNFSHPSKLGLAIHDARTNLITDSEALDLTTPWPNKVSTTTRTANDGEAPDGTQTADSIQADANNAAIGDDVTTTAETEYTGSWFHKRDGAGDVTGRLIIYDETGAAELAADPYTAGTDLTRDSLVATTNVGQVSTSLRVEIDTSGEAVHGWGAMFALGKPTAYIPTSGASASRAATLCQLDNTGGQYVAGPKGEIEVVLALDADVDHTRQILDIRGSDNVGRIQIVAEAGGTIRAILYDDVGTAQQNFTALDPGNWDQEHTIRLRWDSGGGVDGNAETADMIVDGVRSAGAATTWTPANATPIVIGSNKVTSGQEVNGCIATIKAWDAPRPGVF